MPSDLALRPARERLAALFQSVLGSFRRGNHEGSDDDDDDEEEDDDVIDAAAEDSSDDGEIGEDDDDDITSVSSSSLSSSSEESLSVPVLPDPPRRTHSGGARRRSRRTKSKLLPALPSFANSGLQKYGPRLGLHPNTRNATGTAQGRPATLNITDLPTELQVLIISELDFADIQQLRLANHFYHSLITKSLLKDIYGATLEGVILSHCHLCLRRDPARNALLYADITHPKYPFCSRCVDCAVRRNELVPGCRVSMGNFRSAWVCRWCGYPVLVSSAWNHPHFHKRCYSWYGTTLLAYLVLGWIQFCIVFVGFALCFRYFRSDKLVLIPSIISVVISGIPLIIINLRRPMTDRTYGWSLMLEFFLLSLWILPTYAIGRTVASPGFTMTKATIATLIFCALNLIFRLFNTLGNLILLSEFKFWRRKKPDLPLPHRLFNFFVVALVFWTYPRAVEQSYPPVRPRSSGSK